MDGGGPVGGRDAGRHPEAALGIDADGERRGELLGVPLCHLRQAQLIATITGQGQADEAPPVQRHEIDHFGGRKLRGAHEITFVLAVLVVGHDDDLAVAQVIDGLLDSPEARHGTLGSSAATYLAIVSPSRCTRSPTLRSPRVVCCKVNGMREIWIVAGDGLEFTVRLTPSTVIEPSGTVIWAMSAGTPRSSSRPLGLSETRSTEPSPSTWACTRCPPSRSPTRR